MQKRVFLRKDDLIIDLDDMSPVTWIFRSGGHPSDQQLTVSSEVDTKLLGARADGVGYGPWSLHFDNDEQIDHIYFIRRSKIHGRDRVVWTMTDIRHILRGLRVDVFFNRMRSINDFDRPDPATLGPEVAFFTQTPKTAFIPAYCRKAKEFQFYTQGPLDPESFEPWTALGALNWALRDDGIFSHMGSIPGFTPGSIFSFVGSEPRISSAVRDRKVLLPHDYNPMSLWGDAIDELCRMARVLVFPDSRGQLTVVPSDPSTQFVTSNEAYGFYHGSGGPPSVMTSANLAPRITRVHFPEWLEMRWDYDETYVQKAATGLNTIDVWPDKPANYAAGPLTNQQILDYPGFLLTNVVHAPQDTENFKKGQWSEFFHILSDWAADEENYRIRNRYGTNAFDVFNPSIVRSAVATEALSGILCRDKEVQDFRSLVLEARTRSIYEYYRRYFKIPDFWLDYVREFRAITGDIFSTTSRTRQPSPLWMDYYSWDTSFQRQLLDRNANNLLNPSGRGEGFVRNLPLDDYREGWIDENDVRLDRLRPLPQVPFIDWTPAPGTITVASNEMGVLTYTLNPDLGNNSTEYCPGTLYMQALDGDPPATGAMARIRSFDRSSERTDAAGRFMTAPQFRFATILSCLWLHPNNQKRYYTVTRQGSDYIRGANGPQLDIKYAGFDAFRRYEDGKVSASFDGDGKLEIQHTGDIAYKSLIEEIAETEAQKTYWNYLPTVLGQFVAAGWSGQNPYGQFHETAITTQGGLTETVIHGTAGNPKPSIWEFLSPTNRAIFGKLPEGTK